VRGKGKCSPPPQANFKTLVYKIAIKTEIGGSPWQFFHESLDPLEILKKISGTSSGFSTRVHLCSKITFLNGCFLYSKITF
jgi:hypothetical protein